MTLFSHLAVARGERVLDVDWLQQKINQSALASTKPFLPIYLAGMEDDTGHIVDVAPQGVHLPAFGVCRHTHSTSAAAS